MYTRLKILFSLIYLMPISVLGANSTAMYIEKTVSTAPLKDGKLHVYFCGTGVPQVSMQSVRKPSCLAIAADDEFFIIDSGDGAVQTLSQMGLPITQIDKVFLTHLHSDHISGLGEMMNGTWHTGRTKAMTVYGPYGTRQMMAGWKKTYSNDIMFRSIGGNGELKPEIAIANGVEIPLGSLPATVYKSKSLTVSAFPVDHIPVFPALGYTIQYKNCKIVVSGDTKVGDKLEKGAANADVLISESVSKPLYDKIISSMTNVSPARKAFANQIYSYHASSLDLAKMAGQSGVKRLFLTHLLPAIPDGAEIKDKFKAGMNDFYHGPITLADDRDELVISSDAKSPCQIEYHPAQPVGPVQEIQ